MNRWIGRYQHSLNVICDAEVKGSHVVIIEAKCFKTRKSKYVATFCKDVNAVMFGIKNEDLKTFSGARRRYRKMLNAIKTVKLV